MAWRDLYPFQSHFHDLGGVRMHYVDEGAGPPLLFVHGNPTWSFYWRNLILGLCSTAPPLPPGVGGEQSEPGEGAQDGETNAVSPSPRPSPRGRGSALPTPLPQPSPKGRGSSFRCIAVDHIGCGLSDKPQAYNYTLQQRIDDLVSLFERLDLQNATLLAHDWGGAIGLGTVLRLPERFTRIVLFNTGAFPPPFVPRRIAACRTPLVGTLAVRGLNAFARAAISMAVEKPERMTADVRAGLLAPYDSWANRVAVDRFVKDIPFSPRHPTWQTLERIEAGLPSLRDKPIQLIWGMRDWCFRPECLDRFVMHWPQAEVHKFADCGHYVVEDAHERIVPLVRAFLKRQLD